MRNYLRNICIPKMKAEDIDHKSMINIKKKVIGFCSIGLLCTLLISSVSANNGFASDKQIESNTVVAVIIENTSPPKDLLPSEPIQPDNSLINSEISIVTRGNEFQDLRNGSEGADVFKIQQALTDKGYFTGPINSKFGPLTEAAVIAFQKINGLGNNGTVDERLLSLICMPSIKVKVNAKLEGLRNGSEGDEVKKLQQILKDKGFYNGPILGKFGPLTEAAVIAFQKKTGIEVSGIVTTKVMDKLNAYKPAVIAAITTKVPASTKTKANSDTVTTLKIADNSVSVAPSANGVELLDWSQVKTIFAIGLTASVYDARSGLIYKVRSFSNGCHADVEPITAEDTAIMLKTYAGVWKWDPRPVWVTVNGRTIAGSINGMPHGGDTNPNNNMSGQICIHFKGSTTHNGNLSFAKEHQDAVMEAWAAAQK